MIEKLIIKNPSNMNVSWWAEVPQLKQFKEIEFKPGLNILFGPNGSGKSTIIRSLATHFMCFTSGYPIINEGNVSSFFGGLFNDDPKDGYEIIHDGQVVHCMGSSLKLGFDAYGQADWNQTSDLVQTIESNRYSTGNQNLCTMRRILQSLVSVDKIQDLLSGNVNDLWKQKIDYIHKVLETASCKLGQRTLLLDEPDRSLDIPNQATFWNYVHTWAEQFQVIMASHNIFALRSKANIIELQKGYFQKCKKSIKNLI